MTTVPVKHARKKTKKTKGSKKTTKKTTKKAENPTLVAKRGWLMNIWERWLSELFEGNGGSEEPIVQVELVKSMTDFVRDNDGPEDVHSVVRNSVRRLLRDGWVERTAKGRFFASDQLPALKSRKEKVGKAIEAARKETSFTRQDVADLLGHPTKGRYATLEQGRHPMHAWEAQACARAFGVDLDELLG
jgi:hypothetical protein